MLLNVPPVALLYCLPVGLPPSLLPSGSDPVHPGRYFYESFVFPNSLYHPADLIGIPHGIHHVLGISGVSDDIEVRGPVPQCLVQSPLGL